MRYNQNLTQDQIELLKSILSWMRFIDDAFPELMIEPMRAPRKAAKS